MKAGNPLNISNLISPLQGVLPAAIVSTSTFNAPQLVDVATLTLDGHHVQLKPNGQFNCSTGDVSGPNADLSGATGVPDGIKDLNCKFDGVSFPTVGSYYVILEGKLKTGEAIRARDVVNVSR